jgi:type VI secretion system protein VasD
MRFIVVTAALAALAGCAPPPPPPIPPTVVNITLITTADNNPTTAGQGAPLALRVYQLGATATYTTAEFFPLFNDDATTLKTDLIHRDDFLLPPNTTKTETLMPKDPVTAIGFFGAYRTYQTSTWRASADIAPHKTTNITLTAGHDGLTVKSETVASK